MKENKALRRKAAHNWLISSKFLFYSLWVFITIQRFPQCTCLFGHLTGTSSALNKQSEINDNCRDSECIIHLKRRVMFAFQFHLLTPLRQMEAARLLNVASAFFNKMLFGKKCFVIYFLFPSTETEHVQTLASFI